MRDLNKIRNGLLWTGAEKVLIYGVSFVQGVILARLLRPEDFGFCTMLAVFLSVGRLLSECGLGTTLIVNVKGERALCEKSVVVWNVGVALLLYAVLSAMSPFVAHWFGEPILCSLLRVLALSIIISASGVVAVARLMRMQCFAQLSWLNGLSCVMASCIGIAMAYWGYGVWSIAVMMLSQAMMQTVLAWYWALRESRREVEKGNVSKVDDQCVLKNLLKPGVKLMVSDIINTLYYNFYHLLIGKMWSPSVVGLFVRGQRWAQISGEVINDAVGRVSLPKLVCDDSCFGRLVFVNAVILWPALILMWIFADDFVRIVLGAQWIACVPYIRILIVGQFVTPVTNMALNVLKARNRTDLILISDGIKKPLGFLVLGGGCVFGVSGICWAKVVNDFIECIANVAFALKGKSEFRCR